MNIVMYGVLWSAIGLLSGLVVNWVSEAATWPWFWVDLLAGFIGAILFGYLIPLLLYGSTVTHNAYSLLFALLGAALMLAVCALLKKS